jgi:hypothetical protein
LYANLIAVRGGNALQTYTRLAVMSLIVLLVTACNRPPAVVTQFVTVPVEPTNTVAPMVTMTPRFTATPIPTATLMPSLTPLPTDTPAPVTPSVTPTATEPPATTAEVTSARANVRSAPSRDGRVLTSVSRGTTVFVICVTGEQDWYRIRLEDNTPGFMATDLVALGTGGEVASCSADLLVLAEETPEDGTANASGTAEATADSSLAAGSIPYRARLRTDILAYCDLPEFVAENAGRRRFTTDAELSIYWNWYARTEQQILDHLAAAQYEITLNGQAIENFDQYRTNVNRREGRVNVDWYVPIGNLAAGEYTITYRLTWLRAIEDGFASFGPGTQNEVNEGSCVFTVTE